jgi:hypothetical protein
VQGNGEIGVKGISTGDLAPSGDAVGVWGQLGESSGATLNAGVRGDSRSDVGVIGTTYDGTGVRGIALTTPGFGVQGFGSGNDAIGVYAAGYGSGRTYAALRAANFNNSTGMVAYMTNHSAFHTAHFNNAGSGGVLYLQNGGTDADGTGGGDFITAINNPENDFQFRVLSSGEVRSDVGFNTPASDFAEMLPAVEGLQAGDVLAIGPDGKLTRSTEPYQISVAGVYSTKPGFVGGQPVKGEATGAIPLAITGVVPVKVSAENGPIRPGDLLATSSTPAYAMKASPLTVNGVTFYPSGVIIGKALQGLDEGTGVIQVLVALQ